MINPMLLCDGYKVDHRNQYPKGTEYVYSNLTARNSRIVGIDKVVVFGIQYFVMDFLMRRFNQGFFNQPKDKVVAEYQRMMDNYLGAGSIKTEHIAALHDLGYMPIKIKALPEGTLCPVGIPFLTIVNTLPEFFWLTNFLETILSNTIWHLVTSATIGNEYRKILNRYAMETSDMPDFVQWQGHDFSFRGQASFESALGSGAAHLLSFTGTDTIPAISWLEQFYKATGFTGGSVAATEHSVMCMGGKESEKETFLRLLTEVYPKGIVSVVSDTWDYFAVLNNTVRDLKDVVMAREGKLVVRPDSGNPELIICGDPSAPEGSLERKGTINILWEIFGGTVNSKGYRQLDSHIGIIYGDSITLERCEAISNNLKAQGYASTNVVYGIGSYTYQHVTRDTFGMAMKATYGVVNGIPTEIFKKPKTDNGVKNSAKGLLRVNEDLTLSESVTPEEEQGGLLQEIYVNGKLVKEYSLQEIRERLASQILVKEVVKI